MSSGWDDKGPLELRAQRTVQLLNQFAMLAIAGGVISAVIFGWQAFSAYAAVVEQGSGTALMIAAVTYLLAGILIGALLWALALIVEATARRLS